MTAPAATVQGEIVAFAALAAAQAAATVAAWEATGLPVAVLAELLGDLLESVEHAAAALGDTLLAAAVDLSGARAAPLGIVPAARDLAAARKAGDTTARLIGESSGVRRNAPVDISAQVDDRSVPTSGAEKSRFLRADPGSTEPNVAVFSSAGNIVDNINELRPSPLVTETATRDLDKLPRQRAARTARGRATQRLGTYYDLGLSAQPAIAGYTRGLDADPCELCVWLARDGYVYPRGQAMHRHPGCTCVPVPVLTGATP